MPNNTLIFLRHAETKVDKDLKISEWELSERGRKEAFNISQLDFMDNVDIIIASNEKKAYKTADPLAKKKQIHIIREKELNEIMRDKGKFLGKEGYLDTMKLCMENRDQSFNDWETANKALGRFRKKVEEIDSNFKQKKILIVSHGTVINLYFAEKLNKLSDVYERTLSNTFCDYGVIQDGKIIRDIAKIV